MKTTLEYIGDLQAQKANLVSNLNASGVPAENTEKFNTLVPKVLAIKNGNKCYTEVMSLTSVETEHTFTVDFEPKYICLSADIQPNRINGFIPSGTNQFGIYEYFYIEQNAFGENIELKKNSWVKPDGTISTEISPNRYYLHKVADNGDGTYDVTIGGDLVISSTNTYHYNLLGGTSALVSAVYYLFVAVG